jgi:hypothetical protein
VNSKVPVSCAFSNIKLDIFATQDSKDNEVVIIEKSSKASDSQPEMQLEFESDEEGERGQPLDVPASRLCLDHRHFVTS